MPYNGGPYGIKSRPESRNFYRKYGIRTPPPFIGYEPPRRGANTGRFGNFFAFRGVPNYIVKK